MSNFLHLWGMPILLAILTMAGLITALVGTGLWHWFAWTSLTIPVVVMANCLYKAFNKK